LGLLTLFAGLYGFYLAYLGLPVVMKTPPDKAGAYLVAIVVIGIIVTVIIGIIVAMVTGVGLFAAGEL